MSSLEIEHLEYVDHPLKESSKRKRYAAYLAIGMHLAPLMAAGDFTLAHEIEALASAQIRRARALFRGGSTANKENTRKLTSTEIEDIKKGIEGLKLGKFSEMSDEEREKVRKSIEDMIIYKPEQAKQLVETGVLDLEEFKLDYGRFFLETEFVRGATEEETVKAWQELQRLRSRLYEKNLSPFERRKRLDQILREYSSEQTWSANFMGDLLRNKHGNCMARAKLALSLVERPPNTDWQSDMNFDETRIQGMESHIRPVIKHYDQGWYALDGAVRKLPSLDITGTAIMKKSMFVESYLGIESDVRIMDEGKETEYSRSVGEMLVGALIAGADHYLAASAGQNLRSVYDLKWFERPEEEPIEIGIEFEVDLSKEGTWQLSDNGAPPKEEEKPEFTMTREMLMTARLTGRAGLTGSGIRDISQLKDIEVEEVYLSGTRVSDLSPLRGKPIKRIEVGGAHGGSNVTDLSPLQGAPIEYISVARTNVSDLSPLKDSPIRSIDITGSKVTNLSPLKGIPLERVYMTRGFGADSLVADIEPLEGAPIKSISIGNRVSDISVLENAPLAFFSAGTLRMSWGGDVLKKSQLESLEALRGKKIRDLYLNGLQGIDFSVLKDVEFERIWFEGSEVSDISFLQGKRIKMIDLTYTSVSDLSALEGMPLEKIFLEGSQVVDLSPLAEAPLSQIHLNDKATDLKPISETLRRLRREEGIIKTPYCYEIDWQQFQLVPDKGESCQKYIKKP